MTPIFSTFAHNVRLVGVLFLYVIIKLSIQTYILYRESPHLISIKSSKIQSKTILSFSYFLCFPLISSFYWFLLLSFQRLVNYCLFPSLRWYQIAVNIEISPEFTNSNRNLYEENFNTRGINMYTYSFSLCFFCLFAYI